MNLLKLEKIVDGKLIGNDIAFTGVSIDTRTIQKGNLFIAIKGECLDGHDYVQTALNNGAAAVLVQQKMDIDCSQVIVNDTRKALYALARFYRNEVNIPVVGITGSCGKTTVRAMVENILKQKATVLATQKSFNNDIGVPLTLMQLTQQHQYAVIEMGANHAGEIAQLTQLVRPDVAVITCAAQAHLAGFGDLPGVARAKGEIFQGLTENGVAIINADDQFATFWKTLAGNHKVITFGFSADAMVRADHIMFDDQGHAIFELHVNQQAISLKLPLIGKHNVYNALASAAVAVALDISIDVIKQGLETATPVNGRLIQTAGWRGAKIIDDSYNANPTSVLAAIDVLLNQKGDHILVLGDMLELGEKADSIHASIGQVALEKGLSRLYCYGSLTEHAARAFGENAKHFATQEALISALKAVLTDQTIVLVKGSNSMKMNQVVAALI